jgi:hypothetical protein
MSRRDRLALILSLLAVLLAALITDRVFERMPHLEDEMAYIWEAKAIAGGHAYVPSPPCPECFLYPFVVDYQGIRFGKYPLGWPVVLALGALLGIRQLINPILGGITIWLVYLLVKKILDDKAALLATFLLTLSPFFLMNSASLLSHPWSLFLSAGLALAWLDTFSSEKHIPAWMTVSVAGLCLGVLALTRPLTAVGVALPFFFHGLWILLKGSPIQRRQVVIIGILGGLTASIHFLWQFALTGNLTTNPYTLWWPYDTIGFGPGKGLQEGGYSIKYAMWNGEYSIWVGWHDLFGWLSFSWIFLPFGLIAIRRNWRALLVSSTMLSIVFVYGFYWIGSWTFGPRYYYEALIGAVLLSAAGIRWAAGRSIAGSKAPQWNWIQGSRLALTTLTVVFLITCNVVFYIPQRIGNMTGLYGINASRMQPFLTQGAKDLSPALVIVHPQLEWTEYGALLDLTSPYLEDPIILTIQRGQELNEKVAAAFPERTTYHYYTDEPFKFYLSPRPPKVVK